MIFKRCLNPNCNKIVWFSETMICTKCMNEANGIIEQIGKSRSSRKSMSTNINLNMDLINSIHVLPHYTEDQIPSDPKKSDTNVCESRYDNMPTYSSDSFGSGGSNDY